MIEQLMFSTNKAEVKLRDFFTFKWKYSPEIYDHIIGNVRDKEQLPLSLVPLSGGEGQKYIFEGGLILRWAVKFVHFFSVFPP